MYYFIASEKHKHKITLFGQEIMHSQETVFEADRAFFFTGSHVDILQMCDTKNDRRHMIQAASLES